MKKFLRAFLDREFERFKPKVMAWIAEFLESEARSLAGDGPSPAPAAAPRVLHTESDED